MLVFMCICWVYADNVNVLGGSVHTVERNTEVLLASSKKTELEVNADKIKCMVVSRDQIAGKSNSLETDNSSFERVEEFKCLGTTVTYQNSIQEEVKSRLKSGNACYHSVQNLFFFQFAIQKFKD